MSAAKNISLIGIFTALLIGAQFALSAVSGVEVVTVLLISFAFYFGLGKSLLAVNAFSILRCFIFGFFADIIILYLVYYNLFVLVFGLLGVKFKHTLTAGRLAVIIAAAVVMTVLFTVLSDIITPLYYRFNWEEAKAFALASLTAVIPQTVCTFLTTLFILPILIKVYNLSGLNKRSA